MTSALPEGGKDGFRARQVTRPRAQVEQQLKEAILRGTFGQGERLPPETELAHQFGISRPTLREALGALASAGLIHRVPGVAGGNFVNSVTPASLSKMLSEAMTTILRLGSLSVDEIAEVRGLLEIPAARAAATNRSAAHISEMSRIIERDRLATVDDGRSVDCGLSFHAAVGHASGNRLLAAFTSAVHAACISAGSLDVTPEFAKAMVEQHAQILAAVEAGDPDAAATAMSRHLSQVPRHSATPTPIEEP